MFHRIAGFLLLATWAAQGQVPSIVGQWTANFYENGQAKFMEFYFDPNGNFEIRSRDADSSTGSILTYQTEIGIYSLNTTRDTLFIPRTDTSVEADNALNVIRSGGRDTMPFFVLLTAISPDTVRVIPCDSGICDLNLNILFVYGGPTRAFTLPNLLSLSGISPQKRLQIIRPNSRPLIWKGKPWNILGRYHRPTPKGSPGNPSP